MALPPKQYYKLAEVAQRWKRDEDDLLQWAETGDLALAFHSDPRTVGVIRENPDEPADGWPYRLHYYYIDSSFLYVDKLNISKIIRGEPDFAHMATPAIPGIDELLAEPPNYTDRARPDIVKLAQQFGSNESLIMVDEDGDPIGTHVPYLTIPVVSPPKITKDILIVLSDDLEFMEDEYPELKPGEKTSGAIKTIDNTNLLIIGALLGVIVDKEEGMFRSQAALIDKLLDLGYGDYRGISKRNLEDRFKQAKNTIEMMDI